MATKKKSTVEDLQKSISSLTKKMTVTREQIDRLRDLATDVMNIRRTLEDLEGADDISTIMFKIGSMYHVAETAESSFDELIDEIDGDCDECDEDY